MNEKETGSFYTPKELIEYMIAYLETRIHPRTILEPSAGDGRFVEYLNRLNADISLIEFDKNKASLLESLFSGMCNVCCTDFIKFANQSSNRYSLIVGNPPYIAKKNVPDEQCTESEKILEYFKLEKSVFQNLWVSFVLASIKLLEPNGAIFFVLPFEFLQVQYAEKLRAFLETKFNTIEIITFEEKVFQEIEQDICLVYLSNEQQAKPYIQYTTYDNVCALNQISQSVIMRNKPLKKWSNCILNDEETERLMAISQKYIKVAEVGDISPGIVTGANSFFIQSENEITNLHLPAGNILPIITKSAEIPPLLLLNEADFKRTFSPKNRTHLMSLTGLDKQAFSQELNKYIKAGEEKKLNEGYKCSKRTRWYDVPIIKKGEACFFKRYHIMPRVIVNHASLHTTDIIYNIRFNKGYDAASFAFCFYNSLTLALCEYNGRFYGGGVGELVPSEFKQLRLPYKNIDTVYVAELDTMIRNQVPPNEIVDFVDGIVLSDLAVEDRNLLQEIRKRYLKRRIGNEVTPKS